ncbi:O-antigen ligase family protein [Candidatus Daviesbacteria bacterium]|nr:O-antigen ligase family protein [Candidatus Daviesbacteria bacterium]
MLLFFTPLLIANLQLGYEVIKIVFFLFMVGVAGIIWFFLSISKSKDDHKIRWSLLKTISGLFILVLAITSIYGIDPQTSLIGDYPYYQGLLTYIFLFLAFIFFSVSKISLKEFSRVFALSALLVAFLAVSDFILMNLFSRQVVVYSGRIASTFGQSNFYAGFLLLSLPFAYYLIGQKEKISFYLGIICLVFTSTGILISGSRAAILMLGLLVFFWLLSKAPFKKIMVFISVVVTSAALFASYYYSAGLVFKEIIQPRTNQWLIDNSPEKRVYLWEVLAKLILQKPYFGYGLENMGVVYSNFFTSQDINSLKIPYYYSLRNLAVTRSHSYFVDILFFSGIVGLVMWIILLAVAFLQIRHKKSDLKQPVYLFFAVYVLWSSFQNQSIVHLIYFWSLLGIIDQS